MQSIRVTGEIWVEGEPNVSCSYSEYKEKENCQASVTQTP